MDKKDFYNYAVECNNILVRKTEHVEKMRDDKLKSASAKMIEIASFIKDNGGLHMTFEICLNRRFKEYEYNWASIRIEHMNIYIFVVNNKEQRDIIYQLYKRLNILIFDNDVDMDTVGTEIIRKISEIDKFENNNKKDNGK